MKIALIVIGRFKPAWNNLSEEEQAAFAAQVGRTARKAGVTPIVGYTLTTQGSFLEIWEADDKATLDAFVGLLHELGYKNFYDEVLMIGQRAETWIAETAGRAAEARPAAPKADGAQTGRKKPDATRRRR